MLTLLFRILSIGILFNKSSAIRHVIESFYGYKYQIEEKGRGGELAIECITTVCLNCECCLIFRALAENRSLKSQLLVMDHASMSHIFH